ncbi:PRC-barrel domain-containing protein [Patescibacteria group bacterium]|nr:PRC-barrel domain-containing protein [Patescibacteria group bacterium]MBU1703481.1 PRC-barrel domain-containing protein [Patescibacteria group bacterium]MBU1953890.1 PRC-barrel domain-containing protein [Patescibacteria group bacterium]
MENYYRQTIGSPVVTRSGETLTIVRDIIFDHETGKIVGFLVTKGKNLAVTPIDILRWNKSIFIHDRNDIVEIEEVVKLHRAVEKNISIYNKKVFTKSGDYTGKVIDYGMHGTFFELTCLIVAKSFLGLIFWDRKIISAKDIIEVQKDRIIVKDLVKPLKMQKFQVDMAPLTQ